MDSNRFPLQNAIKKILDNPSTRPVLPGLKDRSSSPLGLKDNLSSSSDLKFNDALYSKAYWGAFKKDKPSADGKTTQYSARLYGANKEGWEEACEHAPAVIRGQYFPKPTRCKKITFLGIGIEMWGEFDVKKENLGNPTWGEFKEENCTWYGSKQYSAQLLDIKGSWEEACNNASAVIKGQWFDRPTRIVKSTLGLSGIRGQFDVEDDSCGSLTKLVEKINDLIAKGKGKKKVSRRDLNIGKQKIHLDLGGEGYHEIDGVVSGFRTAINLNDQKNDSQYPKIEIPHLVLVNYYSEFYPFADGFADYITMQGAPLTEHNANEIARMLRKGGKVGLWIDNDYYQNRIKDLASKLKSKPKEVNKYEDEFGGKSGGYNIKVLIEDGRPPDHDEF
ncbi:hypothetical protein [Nostoc sp. ChiVER01]|uniref:hypothetical protein n=1 Tax=Nostoc sp. ChiVER01 TaxID=3075382 RepID=UPI002AD54A0A|nr:hypothetical protein [Nostoc sp. ChiVER01]MDZ8224746.1 hypothetical protein [Nostoc sp. ChiVER01]